VTVVDPWARPKVFQCDGCGTVASGALTWNALGSLPPAETLPAGWMLRREREHTAALYACSVECTAKVDARSEVPR